MRGGGVPVPVLVHATKRLVPAIPRPVSEAHPAAAGTTTGASDASRARRVEDAEPRRRRLVHRAVARIVGDPVAARATRAVAQEGRRPIGRGVEGAEVDRPEDGRTAVPAAHEQIPLVGAKHRRLPATWCRWRSTHCVRLRGSRRVGGKDRVDGLLQICEKERGLGAEAMRQRGPWRRIDEQQLELRALWATVHQKHAAVRETGLPARHAGQGGAGGSLGAIALSHGIEGTSASTATSPTAPCAARGDPISGSFGVTGTEPSGTSAAASAATCIPFRTRRASPDPFWVSVPFPAGAICSSSKLVDAWRSVPMTAPRVSWVVNARGTASACARSGSLLRSPGVPPCGVDSMQRTFKAIVPGFFDLTRSAGLIPRGSRCRRRRRRNEVDPGRTTPGLRVRWRRSIRPSLSERADAPILGPLPSVEEDMGRRETPEMGQT